LFEEDEVDNFDARPPLGRRWFCLFVFTGEYFIPMISARWALSFNGSASFCSRWICELLHNQPKFTLECSTFIGNVCNVYLYRRRLAIWSERRS